MLMVKWEWEEMFLQFSYWRKTFIYSFKVYWLTISVAGPVIDIKVRDYETIPPLSMFTGSWETDR